MRQTWFAFLTLAIGMLQPARAGLPSLEDLFDEPQRKLESLSPSGRHIAYLGPDDGGETRLWILDPLSTGVPVMLSTKDQGSVCSYFWLPDDGLLWRSGNQDNGHPLIWFGTPTKPVSRLIKLPNQTQIFGPTPGKTPRLVIGTIKPDGQKISLSPIGLNEEEPPTPIEVALHGCFQWCFDGAGLPVAGLRWTREGYKELVDLRQRPGMVIHRTEPGDDLRLLDCEPDGSTVYVITNRDSDLTRLDQINLRNGRTKTLASDPMGQVDLDDVIFDRRTREPLAARYTGDRCRWQSLHPNFSALLAKLDPGIPYELVSASCCDTGKRWLLGCRDPRGLISFWFLEVGRPAIHLTWPSSPPIDPVRLGKTTAITYPAHDGTPIPAFLTLPPEGSAPWPLVVFPHGGPNARTTPGYDARVQFLATRGYAVLQPNFRGSRGYGKKFMNAGDGEWGTGIMQGDVNDGVAAMVRRGSAKQGRIAILGGSYGGYSAMAGLAFDQETYAAGVSLFGISDLAAHIRHNPPEWAPFHGDLVRRLGDPATPDGSADLAARSPLHHAQAVTAPLLLYHGQKDNLVPPDHSISMARTLVGAGSPVALLASPDEGHGFTNPIAEMAVYRAIEVFLHQHLGGLIAEAPSERVLTQLEILRASGKDLLR